MAITAQIIADMQLDIGIDNSETVFTDDELTRLYERADEDYATAVYFAFRALLANAAKRYDYQAGQTNVKAGDVFDHLYKMLQWWESEAESGGNQMKIVGLRSVPTTNADFPFTLPSYRQRNFARYRSRRS